MIASAAGIPTVVADAASAAAALAGAPVGTYFAAARGRRPATRLLWLRHAAVARGSLRLDQGAVEAVVTSARQPAAGRHHRRRGHLRRRRPGEPLRRERQRRRAAAW